ncbi:hypothetical protein ACUSIJ_15990 [Pseudochelatococcus sp. B33]
MRDQDCPEDHDARVPETAPGEFDRLLREIEKEAVPARLLELALELQAALAARRRRREGEERP